jgi:peptide/nickel transport system permease protein
MADLMHRPPKRRGRIAFVLACAWLSAIGFCAIFANVLPISRPDVTLSSVAPMTAPRLSFVEPLGTDDLGRSVASRLIFGARESLIVGVVSVAIAMVAGLAIGMVGGFLKGRTDVVVRVILDSMLSIPALVTLLAIAGVGKRSLATVVIALSVVFTPTFARLARAQTLARADRDFVTAARAMGAGKGRILIRELLPQVVLQVSSYAFLLMALAIVAEGSLSYLGVGIPPPAPSWGGMVNEGRPFLQTQPFLVFVPATCLVLTVVSFTIVGDRARRRFDVGESMLS